MAKIYVTEHADFNIYNGNMKPVVSLPPITTQTLTSSGASQASAAFNVRTKIICVHTDGICSIAVGNPAPTVSPNDLRLAANTTQYFEVLPGSFLSYITNT